MVLLVVTLPFVWFGFVFGLCACTWPIGRRRFPGCIGFLMLLLRVVRDMVLLICLLKVLLKLGFLGALKFQPGLPVLGVLAGPIQHFRAAVLDAWRHRVSMSLCSWKGFRGGPFLDVSGTMQLLDSDHVRERDKALLRGVLVGGVWNGFFIWEGQGLSCVLSVLWCS